MANDEFNFWLGVILRQFPYLAVAIFTLVIAVVHSSRSQTMFRWLFLSSLLMGLSSLIYLSVFAYTRWAKTMPPGAQELIDLLWFTVHLIRSGSVLLMLSAAFAYRTDQRLFPPFHSS